MRLNNESGQSLFELLLAIGISALVIVVLVSLVSNALQNAAFSRNETQAARYAQSATEWLRGQRDNKIDTFIKNATTAPFSWCLKDESLTDSSWNKHTPCTTSDKITGTIFYRQVDFTTSTVSGKKIYLADVAVSWTDSKGIHKATSSTKFSDWRER